MNSRAPASTPVSGCCALQAYWGVACPHRQRRKHARAREYPLLAPKKMLFVEIRPFFSRKQTVKKILQTTSRQTGRSQHNIAAEHRLHIHTLMATYRPFTTSTARSTSPHRQPPTVSTTCHPISLEQAKAIMNPPPPLPAACVATTAGGLQQYGLGVMRMARSNRGAGKVDIIIAILKIRHAAVAWRAGSCMLCSCVLVRRDL